MTVRRVSNGDGVVVDAENTDGAARVLILGDGRAELTVMAARGTFPTSIALGPEAARALAAELLRIGGAS